MEIAGRSVEHLEMAGMRKGKHTHAAGDMDRGGFQIDCI